MVANFASGRHGYVRCIAEVNKLVQPGSTRHRPPGLEGGKGKHHPSDMRHSPFVSYDLLQCHAGLAGTFVQ